LVDLTEFENDRIAATSHFAQSMIVIDDEAFQGNVNEVIKRSVPLVTPGRAMKPVVQPVQNSENETLRSKSNLLDAKKLIETSLGLGIVCSVLRAEKSPKLKKQIITASQNADIVSLDWEIENDSGELARSIIEGIVRSDINRNGRVRLISVYTSTRNRRNILEKVRDGLNSKCKGRYSLDGDHIKSAISGKPSGLRIIVLFKIHGSRELRQDQLAYAVNEKGLPKRLLQEFANLSEGLLGNVAMATIGAIRGVSHHVLKTFDENTDGPYLHHRTQLEAPWESQDYAIDLILSEIKKSVIRNGINQFSNQTAIENFIRHKLNGEERILSYRDQENQANVTMSFNTDQLISLIVKGVDAFSGSGPLPEHYNKNQVKRRFHELYFGNKDEANKSQLKFASMSQMGLTPTGHRIMQSDSGANLTTGSIIKSSEHGYLICIQAKCDTVRRSDPAAFIFAKMNKVKKLGSMPVFIVYDSKDDKHIILEIASDAYTSLITENFKPDTNTKEIAAATFQGCRGLNFKCLKGNYYRWIGNAKSRRSLRAVHSISQSMSRIGFDEFEPFRK